jgi:hypothetical protein
MVPIYPSLNLEIQEKVCSMTINQEEVEQSDPEMLRVVLRGTKRDFVGVLELRRPESCRLGTSLACRALNRAKDQIRNNVVRAPRLRNAKTTQCAAWVLR